MSLSQAVARTNTFMDNISAKKTGTEYGIKWPSMTQIYDREACTRDEKCPYCPAVFKLLSGFELLNHLQLHLEGSLREHQMYDFLMKESDTLRIRCRYQCDYNLRSTTTPDEGINKKNDFYNKFHYAREHYYGEDQMVPIESRIKCNRCPFRCSKSYEHIQSRWKHEGIMHKKDRIVFTGKNLSLSERCKKRCLHQQGHVGHPKTDPDIFQENDWNQCRKQCLGFPHSSDSDSESD